MDKTSTNHGPQLKTNVFSIENVKYIFTRIQ